MTKRDVRALRKCCEEYHKIYTIEDLQRKHLTLVEYNAIGEILGEIVNEYRSGETILQRVADWCGAHGLNVKPKGIGWVISAPMNS